ncbi:hypothetical protein DITRI_Ditri04bG0022400 [Diplodiscus trichospermus]
MEDEDQKELQLLPTPLAIASSTQMSSRAPDSSSLRYRSLTTAAAASDDQYEGPSLDLQLSISLRPIQQPSNCVIAGPICDFDDVKSDTSCVESLKWQAAEQIRMAAIEKAYAERVRELTQREMELAQSEFARARHMWQRARDEVEKAERMKERATRQVDSTCMEITCQSCRQSGTEESRSACYLHTVETQDSKFPLDESNLPPSRVKFQNLDFDRKANESEQKGQYWTNKNSEENASMVVS